MNYRYKLYTLVDITKTDVIHNNIGDIFRRNQQRNWETLTQILSLRTQLSDITNPIKIEKENLTNYRFGTKFVGTHSIWITEFVIEFADVFGNSINEFLILYKDLDLVPIITGLSETVKIDPEIFSTSIIDRNIYVELLSKEE